MLKFELYNPVVEKGGCILRTFMKLFDKSSDEIKDELVILTKSMGNVSYKEVDVFERYLISNGYKKIDGNNVLVKDMDILEGEYAVFCYKDDYYHMFPIIDGIIYDKNDNCLNLFVISLYKKN